MENKHTFWVYYLSLSEKLPSQFFKLSAFLNKYGIMLLPIKPNQLKDFTKEQDHVVVVTFVTNLKEHYQLNASAAHIKFLLLNKKIRLLHLSSFEQQTMPRIVQDHYQFEKLPIKTQNVLSIMLKMLYNSYKETKVWPGGKRARLPA